MINPIDIQAAHELYQNAKPFKHIVIENAINEDILNAVHDEFPKVTDHKEAVVYDNPLERKNITAARRPPIINY